MSGYILILLVFVLAWAVVYLICDSELLAPSSLMLIAFILAVGLSMPVLNTWNEVQLSESAIACFVIMAVGIIAGAVLSRAFFSSWGARGRSQVLVERFSLALVSLGCKRWIALAAVLIVGIAVYTNELVHLADLGGMGSSDYFAKARWVREHYNVTFSIESIGSGVGFSGLASRLQQIIMLSGYVGALALAACLWRRSPAKTYLGPSAIMLIACCFDVLKGARGDIVHYVLAIIIALFAFKVSESKNKAAVSARFIVVGAALLAAVMVFFFIGGTVLRGTAANPIDYISFYFGCGVPSLSYVLDFPISNEEYIGVTTFSQLYISLYKYGIVESAQANAANFVSLGPFQSNVFTACYRYFADFGYMGIFVFGTLSTVIMSEFNNALKRPRHMSILIFALFALTHAADVIRDDFIFASLLSPTLVWYVLEVALIVAILTFGNPKFRCNVDDCFWCEAMLRGDVSGGMNASLSRLNLCDTDDLQGRRSEDRFGYCCESMGWEDMERCRRIV